jgi:hypothetical protein
VRAAIDVQRAMTIRTADFVPEERIEFRAKEKPIISSTNERSVQVQVSISHAIYGEARG